MLRKVMYDKTSLATQMVKRIRQECGRPRIDLLVRKIPWRGEWQSTPVFLPGEFHRQRTPMDYSPWGCKESDMTEQLTFRGFPGSTSSKEPACQCRRHKRHGFDPRVRKIPWRRAWQPTPVFLPGEFPWTEEPSGLQSIGLHRVGHNWSDLACTHMYK